MSDLKPVVREHFGETNAVVVVAGDAKRIAEGLSKFGEVTVLEPERGFAEARPLPARGAAR